MARELSDLDIRALDKIADYADEIYAQAAGLDKPYRHTISDAAKLIQWLAVDATKSDEETKAAIATLVAALSEQLKPTT